MTLVTGEWWYKIYGVIHGGSLKKERQKGELYSQLWHTLLRMSRNKKGLYKNIGSRQKMTGMDSKRATTKCIATVLVYQASLNFLL